jgi:signal transduction histidine kinase
MLRAGNLYNFTISFLICLSSLGVAWIIYRRGQKSPSERTFTLFLSFLGAYWLAAAAGNLLAWGNLLEQAEAVGYLVKLTSVFPPLFLFYYFTSEIFVNKTTVRRLTFLYALATLTCLYFSFNQGAGQIMVTYWGVGWELDPLSQTIFLSGLLLPLLLLVVFLLIRGLLNSVIQKQEVNYTLYFGGFLFVLLQYLQLGSPVITWQRLLVRILYLLIILSVYIYFRSFPRETTPALGRRFPFFLKLSSLFILLAVVPIMVSSLLMFLSLKEIVDLFLRSPASREAFFIGLNNLQVQSWFLTLVTSLLVIVASLLVSRSVAGSLEKVVSGMGRVARGDFNFKLIPESNDEVGDVARYFNQMAEEIKHSREILENWNRELENKVAERTQDLRTLYNISKAVGSTLDLELLIKRALDQILQELKLEAYALLLPGEKGKYQKRASQGWEIKEIMVEEGRGLLGEALSKKEPLYTANLAEDHRCQEQWYKTLRFKTLVVVPLQAKGQNLGLLLMGARQSNYYTRERELNLLSTVSDQLAVALENVGVYEKEKEAVARLTELDRMKNDFISMVSHELRTPVTSVESFVSLFLDGTAGPLTEEQKQYMLTIKKNDQRLLVLIERLLDFSEMESGRFAIKRELVSLNEVIHSVADECKLQLEEKQAQLRLELSARQVKFMGDRDKMAEVLVNLIENALKFKKEDEPLRIAIKTRDEGNFIRVEVIDNGLGISPENIDKIFNKYYQVEETLTRRVGGVGLGLAIVREIIGNHQGKIWAESEGLGKGTKFIFTIPVAEKT